MDCSFCTDPAVGLDVDDEPTCGSVHCDPVVSTLPVVIEVSGDDEEPPMCPECGSTEYNGTEAVCMACSVRAYRDEWR